MTEIKIPEFDLTQEEYDVYELIRDDKGEHYREIVSKWCKSKKKNITPLNTHFVLKQLNKILEKGYCYQTRPNYYKT